MPIGLATRVPPSGSQNPISPSFAMVPTIRVAVNPSETRPIHSVDNYTRQYNRRPPAFIHLPLNAILSRART